MRIRAARLAGPLVAVVVLAGCATDIHALADEMRPVVTDLVQLVEEGPVPDDLYLSETDRGCGDDRQRHYSERIRREDVPNGVNGYTVDTLTDAVRDRLVLPGWTTTETDLTETSPHFSDEFRSTVFEAVPDGGGAELRVAVWGDAGGPMALTIRARTDCAPVPPAE